MTEPSNFDANRETHDPLAPIGIFDSGIGGLTVARAILDLLPRERLVYFGDTARVPYGNKSPETVRRYSAEISRFFVRLGVKMIVVACNTSSAAAWDTIVGTFRGPAIGVVEPGATAAARATRNKKVGVIGTRSTISSGAYDRALRLLDPTVEVWSQPCPLFVPLAEEGWADDPVTRLVAEKYLSPLVAKGIDTIILGCTHYPLLYHTIRSVLGTEITLVNSADETAKAVEAELSRLGLLSTGGPEPSDFCASDHIEGFQQHYRAIIGDSEARFHLLTDLEAAPARLIPVIKNIGITR